MGDFAKRLAQMMSHDDFMEASQSAGKKGGDKQQSHTLPPGRYQIEVMAARLAFRNSDNRPYCSRTYKVLTGKAKDQRHDHFQWLSPTKDGRQIGMQILLGDFKTCGIDCKSLADMDEALEEMVGMVLEIQVKANDPYPPRTFVNNMIDTSEDDDDVQIVEDETPPPPKKKRGRPKKAKQTVDTDAFSGDSEFDDGAWEA
jgi:hypothetical protein